MRGTRLLTVVLFLGALCVFAPSALAASGWYELGPNVNPFSPDVANFPSLAVVGGTLYMAASIASVQDQFNPNRKIHVAKLVGSTWQEV
ncbi:MAG: hypothetical protein QOG86_105, partial [Thermoleophilaceae bacterium]|nr:hypothetical protein [Thermoleophilaceae bacterium]